MKCSVETSAYLEWNTSCVKAHSGSPDFVINFPWMLHQRRDCRDAYFYRTSSSSAGPAAHQKAPTACAACETTPLPRASASCAEEVVFACHAVCINNRCGSSSHVRSSRVFFIIIFFFNKISVHRWQCMLSSPFGATASCNQSLLAPGCHPGLLSDRRTSKRKRESYAEEPERLVVSAQFSLFNVEHVLGFIIGQFSHSVSCGGAASGTHSRECLSETSDYDCLKRWRGRNRFLFSAWELLFKTQEFGLIKKKAIWVFTALLIILWFTCHFMTVTCFL